MRKGHELDEWMPLFLRKWLTSASIRAMKDTQRGWYIELLVRAWDSDRPCHLRYDMKRLWMKAGADSEVYFAKRCEIVLAEFQVVTIEGEQWIVQPDQLEIYKVQLAKYLNIAENGRKGGLAKASNAVATLERSQQTTVLVSNLKSKSNSLKKERKELPIPDWIPLDSWNGFVEMRKKMRKPLTDRAQSLLVTKLEALRQQGNNPGEVLDQSVTQGWQGIFEVRKNSNGNGKKHELYRCECGAMNAYGTRECEGCHYALKWK